MKTCGIDLKGNEAIVVCVDGNADQYRQIAIETKRIALADSTNQAQVKNFLQEITDFLHLHQIEKVGIKERATKGKFAGGSVSFKMEGLIQCSSPDVCIIHPASVKAKLKNQPAATNISVNQYQKDALSIARYLLD
ncbi:MAG: DUF3010 family protein [Saprospiraceae bacterium]|nr:DUF3010 family protein [Saprospiraceae bacterium]